MASTADAIRRSPFAADRQHGPFQKPIPILPSSASNSSSAPTSGNAMDVTPQQNATMGPPVSSSSPVAERNGANNTQMSGDNGENATNGNGVAAIGAAAAAQQPKVVQTAFIHKLYNMLEDQSIQHLISWSNTNESFVMSPSSEFSKVLSSYFKHTNISSFVRQLNMYGFHKVSDVFHTGSPDSPLWEFKHGNNNFKRGDLIGLREIKRRASRHALIHRDSFPAGSKAAASQPGTPVETIPDSLDLRLNALEHNLYDMHVRLGRSEDGYATLSSRYQLLLDGLTRCHQWNQDLSGIILGMVPESNNPLHRDVSSIQRETARHLELLKTIDESHDPLSARPYLFQISATEQHAPLSPHQMPNDDQRRSSYSSSRGGAFRPSVSHVSASPRRYGSMGSGTFAPSYRSHAYAPLATQPPPPPPPPPPQPSQQHLHPHGTIPPSGSSPPMNLARRHTSADIRVQGWQAPPVNYPQPQPPFASGLNSSNWPSSPHRSSLGAPDQQLRDQLARYELPRGNAPTASSSLYHQQQQQPNPFQQQHPGSRHGTPPPPSSAPPSALRMSVGAADSVIGSSGGQQQRQGSGSGSGTESGWSIPPRIPFKPLESAGPPPAVRRSSMASTVHSLLNPAETAERTESEDGGNTEDRKRKRMQ